MLSGIAGVKPVSGRGLLFLVAFVSFLTLSLIGPHIHGAAAAPTPVTAAAATATGTGASTANAIGNATTATNNSATPTPATPTPATPTATAAATGHAPSSAAGELLSTTPQPTGETLGVAAACVLVLLLTIVFFAAHAAPRLAVARQRPALHMWIPERPPRGLALPLFRLLSISRT